MGNPAGRVLRHSLVTFFVLAYGLSWGSYHLLGGPFLFPFGPFVAALIVAGASRGRAGLSELLRRCLRWRVGLHGMRPRCWCRSRSF